MTLHANKLRVSFILVQLVIEYAAVASGGGYVTTFSTAARSHRDFLRLGDVVAFTALDFRVCFMTKRARRGSSLPQNHDYRIVKPDRVCQLSIEIDRVISCRLMTNVAALR